MAETVAIDNRSEFVLWAIELSKEIVSTHATALALAARDCNEDEIRTAGNALGTAITEALLQVFDGLLEE